MKSADWRECIENCAAIKISPDFAKARSLLEIIHAVVLRKGWKVENHVCLGFYLRDIVKRVELFRVFDDARYKRNGLIYYGKKIDFDIAKETIIKVKNIIKELKDISNEN